MKNNKNSSKILIFPYPYRSLGRFIQLQIVKYSNYNEINLIMKDALI